jgi:hypothetical protein
MPSRASRAGFFERAGLRLEDDVRQGRHEKHFDAPALVLDDVRAHDRLVACVPRALTRREDKQPGRDVHEEGAPGQAQRRRGFPRHGGRHEGRAELVATVTCGCPQRAHNADQRRPSARNARASPSNGVPAIGRVSAPRARPHPRGPVSCARTRSWRLTRSASSRSSPRAHGVSVPASSALPCTLKGAHSSGPFTAHSPRVTLRGKAPEDWPGTFPRTTAPSVRRTDLRAGGPG